MLCGAGIAGGGPLKAVDGGDTMLTGLFKRGVPEPIPFALWNVYTNAGHTGDAPSVTVSKDGGAQAAGGGIVTHLGGGQWSYLPTEAEVTADVVAFAFTHAQCSLVNVTIHTLAATPPTASEVAAAVAAHPVLARIAAITGGRCVESEAGTTYTFYAADGITPVATLTFADKERTVS